MESILHYRRKLLNFPREPKQYVTHTIPRYQGTPGLEIIGPSNEHSFCRKCNAYHISDFHIKSGDFHIKSLVLPDFIKIGFVIFIVWILFFKKN
jgi:hypothetical protein